MDLRKQHYLNFAKLSPEERLNWALRTGWANFLALPKEKQKTYMKMRRHEK
ncbi:MAG: hypothetical protein HRT89_09080 [Lentisphaeria bacterium]|nr:hypothetical protein [Lentisphaeria bacterium]